MIRADLYGWGNNYNASFLKGTNIEDIKGLDATTVNMTVEREGSTIKTVVKAVNNTKSYEQYYRVYNVGDGNQDIELLLSVDKSQIIIDKSTISYSDTPTADGHTIIGNRDNSTLWWTQFSDYYTIENNQQLSFEFVNHTSGGEVYYNWCVGITNDKDRQATDYQEYAILRTDAKGWGNYGTSNHETFNYPNDATLKENMEGATVKMTITRVNNIINVLAVMSKDGVDKSWSRRFYSNTMAVGTYRVFLIADHSYIDLDNSKTNKRSIEATGDVNYGSGSMVGHKDYSIAQGEILNLKFKNYGKGDQNWFNWIVKLSGTNVDHIFRADNFVEKDDASKVTTRSIDPLDWDLFKPQMVNSDVDMTITYTADGTFSIHAVSSGNDQNFTHDFSYKEAKTGDISVELGTFNSWFELLSAEKSVLATIGENGYTTFANANALDLASLPSGLKAYKAKINGTVVKFTEVNDAVPANTGLLLEGTTDETYSIPVAASASALADNDFYVNASGTTFSPDANTTYFGLIKNSSPLTFGVFAPATVAIPANKAYLKVADTAARELVASFNDDVTSIETVKTQNKIDGVYYNLAGQRVVAPVKGLYIVNGKKCIIK